MSMELEELFQEVNELSIEDLRELAEYCDALADSLETDPQ